MVASKATLQAIAGFTRPERGRILIGDAIVFDGESGVNLAPRRRRCAWVGARDALFPHLTVRQNLEFYAGIYNIMRSKRRARLAYALKIADLEKEAHRLAAELEQRKTLLHLPTGPQRAAFLDRHAADVTIVLSCGRPGVDSGLMAQLPPRGADEGATGHA